MSLLDTLKKNLTPEQLSAVQDALGDDFNYDVVPRSRLNKVIQQRDEARRQLGQGGNAGGDDGGEGGDGSPNGAGTGAGAGKGFTQADIDAAVNAAKATHEAELKQLRMNHAVLAKLQEQNFVDPNLILSAGLIDTTRVTLDDNGVITDCTIDSLGTSVKFNAEGAVTTDLTAPIQTKNELGENYGMVAWGGAIAEQGGWRS